MRFSSAGENGLGHRSLSPRRWLALWPSFFIVIVASPPVLVTPGPMLAGSLGASDRHSRRDHEEKHQNRNTHESRGSSAHLNAA